MAGSAAESPAGSAAVCAARLGAQLLRGPPATSPEAVVARLLAVQAQDPRGARLSVRSRSVGLAAADVDAALTARRSLVVSWLNRGTLHLVAPEDYWWLQPLTTPQLATGNQRRLAQEGVSEADEARGVEVITGAVGTDGPLTRSELRRHLAAGGVPTAGQALVHLLLAASLRGAVVRGPMRRGEQAFVAPQDWLGPAPEPLDGTDALGRLARRYLAGHGPAAPADLAKWAGITLGQARTGFERISGEVEVREGLSDLGDRGELGAGAAPRLLGPFDPLLLGWASRAPFVGRHQVATTNGIFHPVALVDGRVVGLWGLRAGALTVRLLEPVAPDSVAALYAEAADVIRFLDRPGPVRVEIAR